MIEEKTRVDFNAPKSHVDYASNVAKIPDVFHTRFFIDTLEDEPQELAPGEQFRRRLSDAYYDDGVKSRRGAS